MSGLLNKLAPLLAPPPFVHPANFEGTEYRWKSFVFRPAYFNVEVYVIAAVVLYALAIYVGSTINSRKAKAWLLVYTPFYQSQFSKPNSQGVIRDGNSDFFTFSTGRRNVASLHTVFQFKPRHDLIQWLFQIAYQLYDLQYQPRDSLELDFKLSPSAVQTGFVWALVVKDELRTIKDGRWDLTFTRTSENSAVPSTMSVMSEFADITENIVKLPAWTALFQALADPAIKPYFRSLSITDQPRSRPEAPIDEQEKHVVLSLVCPSASHVIDCLPLVTSVFTLIDSLSRINLRPETKTKLRKYREDLLKDLKKEAEADKKEELIQAAEDKRAAKKRAEEERVSKLSASEQQKYLERERKRSLKKSQGKIVRK
ncbi:DUF1682-domain-containing protein [Fistulina hepatica ATCC 64428]|nr:DUF1682-domain-containing protein [Fistulina hepatica ATCC 64428]